MYNLEEWPEDWGILFAAFASDKIYGTVRLNKFISLMQREGFPIKNKFIIKDMGPYDKNIAIEAERFEKEGLLTIEEKETDYISSLHIYSITDKGNEYTKVKIIPLLDSIPDKFGFQFSFISLRDFVIFNKIDNIVKDIHKQLFLDDREQFIQQLQEAHKQMTIEFNELNSKPIHYCRSYLDYLGFFEFTKESLGMIINKMSNDRYIGKNNVLYNSIELIKQFQKTKKRNETTINICREKNHCSDYPCPIKDEFLNHRFRCIEFNSDLYGINKSLDYIKTDFREIFKLDAKT